MPLFIQRTSSETHVETWHAPELCLFAQKPREAVEEVPYHVPRRPETACVSGRDLKPGAAAEATSAGVLEQREGTGVVEFS